MPVYTNDSRRRDSVWKLKVEITSNKAVEINKTVLAVSLVSVMYFITEYSFHVVN